jgi:hypothetical protein
MRSSIISILAVLVLAGGLLAADDFTGTWIGKTDVPNAGSDDLTLIIQKKDGVYAGTFSDSLGYLVPGTELKEIKVEGSDMSFQFVIADGTLLFGKLALKDGKLSGTWAHPEGDVAEMRFERKK